MNYDSELSRNQWSSEPPPLSDSEEEDHSETSCDNVRDDLESQITGLSHDEVVSNDIVDEKCDLKIPADNNDVDSNELYSHDDIDDDNSKSDSCTAPNDYKKDDCVIEEVKVESCQEIDVEHENIAVVDVKLNPVESDADDEWNAFGDDTVHVESENTDNHDDNWANFGVAATISQSLSDNQQADSVVEVDVFDDDDDDDDFGDFEDFAKPAFNAAESSLTDSSTAAVQNVFPTMCVKLSEAVDKLLTVTSPDHHHTSVATTDNSESHTIESDVQETNSSDIYENMLDSWLDNESLTQLADAQTALTKEAKSVPSTTNVWKNLLDLEDSPTIKYMWSQSSFYEIFLKSINIDARNVLLSRKQALPMFACQLGLLEPSPANAASPDCGTPEGTTPDSSSLDHNLPAQMAQSQSVVVGESSAMPAFDWSSSGLTNPLDLSGSTLPLILDLDLLANRPSSSSVPVNYNVCSTIAAELEAEFLTPTLPTNNNGSIASSLPGDARLKDILKAASSTTSHETKQSELAKKLLRRLPDLSYMRSKVLMFPLQPRTATGTT